MRLHHTTIPHHHPESGGAFLEYLILVITILIGAGTLYALSLLGALNTGGFCNSAMAMTDDPINGNSYFEQAAKFSPSGRPFVVEETEVSCRKYSSRSKYNKTVFTAHIITRFD